MDSVSVVVRYDELGDRELARAICEQVREGVSEAFRANPGSAPPFPVLIEVSILRETPQA